MDSNTDNTNPKYTNEEELTDYILTGETKVKSNMKALYFLFMFIILGIIIKLSFSIYKDIYSCEDEESEDEESEDEENEDEDEDEESDKDGGKPESNKLKEDEGMDKSEEGKLKSRKSKGKKRVKLENKRDEERDKETEGDTINSSTTNTPENYSTYTSLTKKKNNGYLPFNSTYTDNGEYEDQNITLSSVLPSLPKVITEDNDGFYDKSYYQKLEDVQSYYKFNNKPKYSLKTEATKGFRTDYTYDLCSVNKQPIDALDFNGKFEDKKKFVIAPDM